MNEQPKVIPLKFQQVFLGSVVKNKTDICFVDNTLVCLNAGQIKVCAPEKESSFASTQPLTATYFLPKKSIQAEGFSPSRIEFSAQTG